jgi:2-(1,2-epoxy-1,2-dihydrophenyl)acetyl-CoA isomerase
VVCSDVARFSMIFSRRGLSLDNGASWLLPRLIGLARAKEVALFGGMLDAAEADRLGLVNRVLPKGELEGFVAEWAATLAAGPPLALSSIKTLLNQSFSSSMAEAVEHEARCQAVNFETDDMAEAIAAFQEKRDPTFKGR